MISGRRRGCLGVFHQAWQLDGRSFLLCRMALLKVTDALNARLDAGVGVEQGRAADVRRFLGYLFKEAGGVADMAIKPVQRFKCIGIGFFFLVAAE